MIYRVIIKVSYCEARFDFDDIGEASAWMSTAVEKKNKGTDRLDIMMRVIEEEEDGE